MRIYRVTLPGVSGKGQSIFVNFVCGYENFDLLLRDLGEGKIISGEMLITRGVVGAEGRRWEVIGRAPYAIAKGGIGTIEVCQMTFVEAERVGARA